jgi:threonine dehydrogenase-like Zn-dependent dehydrogenase
VPNKVIVMAIDTPARLAVLGAGPLGLEAALYARFLGYGVVIYERGEVAASVRAWSDERMDAPFGQNSTTLGIAAIEAQDDAYLPPGSNEMLTGREWLDRYLLPLAQTDLLADHLRLHTTVVSIGSTETDDGDVKLSVLSRDAAGQEQSDKFDGVLDCTGGANAETWEPAEENSQYYHILGERSHNADSPFRLVDGYEQIRQTFAIIGDRATLDLYASSKKLLR